MEVECGDKKSNMRDHAGTPPRATHVGPRRRIWLVDEADSRGEAISAGHCPNSKVMAT